VSQRVLIVDDEPPARARLRRLLGELGGIDVVGEAGSGEQAVRLAGELRPDVVLLDVRMPGMNGLEAARHLALFEAPPAVVFTTAYDAYAVEAFDAQAIGYLLKPVRAEKLAATLQRAVRLAGPLLARVATADPVSDIYYFAADQKYTTVKHRGGTDLIEDSLRALEEEFPSQFVRVHRNALVSIHSLAAIERDAEGQYRVVVRDSGERLDVSRRLAGELKERFRL
jgi:two-component system, LytTR family, response regulator AlgR